MIRLPTAAPPSARTRRGALAAGLLGTLLASLLAAPAARAQADPSETGLAIPEVYALVEPALHAAALPFAPTMVMARFGVPLAQSWGVADVEGRPALALEGPDVWSFRTLQTWPDGSARWALAECMVPAGQGLPPAVVRIVPGTGKSSSIPIATKLPDRVLIDTGPLQATVSTDDFRLFTSVTVDGVPAVVPDDNPGIVAWSLAGALLRVSPTTQVRIARNEPASAVVEAAGSLEAAAGIELVDFTCRMEFVRGSRDVTVTFTVRNASEDRPVHLALESIELVARLAGVGPPIARFALPGGSGPQGLLLQPGQSAYAYQARSSAPTAGTVGDTPNYLPHLPKSGPSTYVDEGYSVRRDDDVLWSGTKDEYPQSAWADLSRTSAGITVAIRDMAYLWPAALELSAAGHVVAGIFTRHNPAPYTWVWRQHESRTAVFSFHAGLATPGGPDQAARRLDAPMAGRLMDYRLYATTHALGPYDLVSVAEQQQAYALMGLPHQVAPSNPSLLVTRFLPAGLGGGSNNHDSIQRELGVEWLRHGRGGAWRRAMDLALYKAEWQVLRSDDFAHPDDPGAKNPGWPHSKAFPSDDEHRYREGMVLAWRLTGDPRLRDALADEAEILPTVDMWPHERSTYQTLRALAAVADVCNKNAAAELDADLRARLAFFTTPEVDVDNQPGGTGWEGPPGQGVRGYYVHHTQHVSEKPPGEDYVTRGFITASLGPTALFLAARRLGDEPDALRARLRLRDLATYTRGELFPWFADPKKRHLAYSYGVKQKSVNQWEAVDFHPIQLGLAEAWRQTGDLGYLQKAVEQVEAFAAHGSLDALDGRVEFQHFCRALLDAAGQ